MAKSNTVSQFDFTLANEAFPADSPVIKLTSRDLLELNTNALPMWNAVKNVGTFTTTKAITSAFGLAPESVLNVLPKKLVTEGGKRTTWDIPENTNPLEWIIEQLSNATFIEVEETERTRGPRTVGELDFTNGLKFSNLQEAVDGIMSGAVTWSDFPLAAVAKERDIYLTRLVFRNVQIAIEKQFADILGFPVAQKRNPKNKGAEEAAATNETEAPSDTETDES